MQRDGVSGGDLHMNRGGLERSLPFRVPSFTDSL